MRGMTEASSQGMGADRRAPSLQSMRAYLARLEARGELRRLTSAVALRFELAACLAEGEAGAALLFGSIPGHQMPVVGNLLTSIARIAEGLGTQARHLQSTLIRAIETPLPSRLVEHAPCHEVVRENPDLLRELPVPHFFEHEQGPYITAGAIVARDLATGKGNLSIARLMPLGGNRAFVGIAPNHHLAILARAAHASGRKLPIAVTIGNHPAVLVASCLYLGLGDDELEVAGALLGEPVEVVRCKSSDLAVPAHCEIVLEGELDAGEPFIEGPVSEFHGMYENYGAGIVATFSHLTRRADATYQAILPSFYSEHCLLGGVAIAASLARAVKPSVASMREIAVGLGGAGRLHAVVALRDPRPGDARKAMFAVWAAVNLIKRVVVVDDDVDPWDAVAVEWAMAVRMRADRDLVVVPGVRTDRSDPMEDGGTVAKLGIDATRRNMDRDDWTRAQPTEAARARARNILSGT